MKKILITATNTDIGKTYTTLSLIAALSVQGYRVGAMKPIETGVDTVAEDATLLLNTLKKYNPDFLDVSIDEICPIQYKLPAAPYVSKADERIDFTLLKEAAEKLSDFCDILLIESAGGIMTPVEDDFIMIDFLAFFDAKALLITDDQLGCINNTLLNMDFLTQYTDEYVWCVNQKSTNGDFEAVSLPYFKAKFDKVLTVQKDIKEITNNLLSL